MNAQPESRAMPSDVPTDDRREQISWYFYDWANSAFSTTVVTVFLGPYLTSITRNAADANGFVYPFGIPVTAGAYFPYLISLSVLLQVIFLPIIGAIADYSHRKKQFLALFAYIGAFATIGMYFLQGQNYIFGGLLFLIANLAFGASIVIYNAFLPEIASADRRDHVSSIGWATGYIGGGILLALNLVLFSQAQSFGLTTGEAVRISITSAGMWWAIFTLIPLLGLKARVPAKRLVTGERILTVGFRQLRETFSKARNYPQTLLFLAAFIFYNDGIQTVIALSSQFGQEELGLSVETLTSTILMVQFVAFFGAIGFNYIARAIGTKRAIIASLFIWTGTVVYAYGFIQPGNATQFYIMGAVIAVVLGGSQALSRSVYSLMIPAGQEAEYFSLYEVSDKGTSWLGPLIFGLSLQSTGSYRTAILSLIVLFLIGMAILPFVSIRRAAIEAGNQPPRHD